MSDAVTVSAPRAQNARERILSAAYELFARRGIRAVGIDSIIEHSGVARMTLYRHFESKNELVLECLARREQLWIHGWLRTEIEQRAADPRERLLAIFDVLDEWFQSEDFRGCPFVNMMLETTNTSDAAARDASMRGLRSVRVLLAEFARDAGAPDPEDLAHKWHILIKGSTIAACEGDADAAHRAADIGRALLEATLAH